jgi:hypothetical protein
LAKHGNTVLRNRPPAVQTPKAHEGTAWREARLDVFVISIGPPLLVENNEHIGKLRALEVRLVREVKVLNQFFCEVRMKG